MAHFGPHKKKRPPTFFGNAKQCGQGHQKKVPKVKGRGGTPNRRQTNNQGNFFFRHQSGSFGPPVSAWRDQAGGGGGFPETNIMPWPDGGPRKKKAGGAALPIPNGAARPVRSNRATGQVPPWVWWRMFWGSQEMIRRWQVTKRECRREIYNKNRGKIKLQCVVG